MLSAMRVLIYVVKWRPLVSRNATLASPLATPTSSWLRHLSSAARAREKPKDLYAVMGVSPNATQQQIKEAYYRHSMKLHPDKGGVADHSKFTELTEAYAILGRHNLRRKYDKGLLHRGGGVETSHSHAHHASGMERVHRTSTQTNKVKFNFDEFYRAHYGEALKREQLRRRAETQRQRERRGRIFSVSSQRLLIVSVILGVFLVTWVEVGRRRRRGHGTEP